MKGETLDALADFAVGCAAFGAKAAGLPDPSAGWGLFRKGRAALLTLRDDGRADAAAALRFREALEAEWRAWGRLGELPEARREKAVNDADVALPRVLPAPNEIVSADFDAGALADDALARAATAFPVAYEDRGPTHEETWHSRRFLHALVKRTSAELTSRPEWFAEVTPELWKAALPALRRLEAGQGETHARLDAQAAALAEMKAMIAAQASASDGLTLRQAQGLLAAFGADQIAADPLRIIALLRSKADEFRAIEGALRQLDASDPSVSLLRSQAAEHIEAGDLDGAHQCLVEARSRDRDVREDLQGRLNARKRSESRSTRELADLASLRFRYREAATLYVDAAEVLPDEDNEARRDCHAMAAKALRSLGEDFGDLGALVAAVDHFRSHVIGVRVGPDQREIDFSTKLTFVQTLSRLAERSQDERLFGESLTEIEALAKSYPWETEFENRIGVEITHGDILRRMAQLEGNPQRLKTAAHHFELVISKLSTNSEYGQQKIRAMRLYAIVLKLIGEGGQDDGALIHSIKIYRQFLSIVDRHLDPIVWADCSCDLGNALQRLGDKEKSSTRLHEANQAYQEALDALPQEHFNALRARIFYGMSTSQKSLFEIDLDLESLEQSIASCRLALEIAPFELNPKDWIGANTNLGQALRRRGEVTSNTDDIFEALAIHQRNLRLLESRGEPLSLAINHYSAALASLALATYADLKDVLDAGINHARQAHELGETLQKPLLAARAAMVKAELTTLAGQVK